MSKYGESIGIWTLTVGGADLRLEPTAEDICDCRSLMLSDKKDKVLFYNKVDAFLVNLIKRQYPQDDIAEIKKYVGLNINKLFEELLVTFRWVSREELEESKKETKLEIKKLIETS